MRCLFNISLEDKRHMPAYTSIIKANGHSGAVATKPMDWQSLMNAAKEAQAKAIVLSNEETLQVLMGTTKATLDAYRGSRLNFEIPVFVVDKIEHIHTVDHGRWLLDRDLEKIKHVGKPAHEFRPIICDTQKALLDCFTECQTQAKLMAFDIETNPDWKLITCISFAILTQYNEIEVFVIPLIDFDHRHYINPSEYEEALIFIKEILALPIPKIAHNGVYDCSWLLYYNMVPEQYLFDTMIFSWARYSELPRSLDFVASLYLYDYVQWKHEAKEASKKRDIVAYWAYCAKDAWTTLRIMLQQLSISDESDYWMFNFKETFKLSYPAMYCGFEGCLVDTEERYWLTQIAEQKLAQAKKDLVTMSATPSFNPASPQQVSRFIYDILGAKKPLTAKSKSATDEKTLNRIAMQHPLLARVIDLQLSFKENQKLLTTYYYFDLAEGNRATWSLDITGAETGRMASKKSCYDLGLQIQNTPTDGFRSCFVPDPGYDLVEIDKNKSEARFVAYLSKCQKMIDALEDPKHDFYITLSAEFFGVPYEKVTKYMRNKLTKKIIHGSNYLMGADTFISSATPKELYTAMGYLGLKMSLQTFAKHLLSLYHKPFPELKEKWYPDILKRIKITKHLVSPLGWTRRFFGSPIGSNQHQLLRQAVAHEPQNLSVHALNKDFWADYLLCIHSKGEVRLKAQIHDSRFMQIKHERRDYYLKLIQQRDNETPAIIIHGKPMKVPSEVKVSSKNWASMETWHEK